MNPVTVGVPRDVGETSALAALLSQVYTVPEGVPGTQKWLERAGHRNLRVALHGTRVAGGLLVLPLGQWFGGRPVAMAGIAAVAVAPEHRGGGVATELMRGTLRGLRSDGFPISALYPATQTLYRRAGYERAGLELIHSVPAKSIEVRERVAPLRVATDADRDAILACCRRRAAGTNGNLERSEYVWDRIRDGRMGRAYGYVVEERGEISGYVYYVHRGDAATGIPDLWCTDVCATTPGAARRILGFLADHRSLAGKVSWRGGPNDPLHAQMTEQRDATTATNTVWMLRILDVAAAMTARGWAPGVEAELHLDVADDLFDENAGPWLLRVSGGAATCERGGRGDLRIDVRGLASLYTSWAGTGDLAASGLAEGPPAALAAAAAAFAGPTPWMADHF